MSNPRRGVERGDGAFTDPPHQPDCIAARRGYETPFIVYRRMEWRLRRDGTRGGSTGWFVFACNDSRCLAERYVRWDVLGKLIAPSETGG